MALRNLSASFTNGDHGGVKYIDSGVLYLRCQNITEQGLELIDNLYISDEDHQRMIRAEVVTGDLLITIVGSIGNCCVVKGIERANINQNIVKIRPTKEIDPNYLSTFINSRYGRFQIQRLTQWSVQANVNFSQVGDIKVIVPSLNIQRSLVAEIEAARQSRKQKLAQADELLTSINDYFISQLGLIPLSSFKFSTRNEIEGFAVKLSNVRRRLDTQYHSPEFYHLEKQLFKLGNKLVLLKNLSTSFTNGDHGGLKYTESGIRYLRGQSITLQGLDLKDELYISLEDHERMIRSEVISGDVLLTIAGSIGNCCVVRGINRANINQAIVKIRPMPSIDSDYLAAFLNSDYGKLQIRRLANGAVQLNVNFSEIGDIQVLVPSLEIQQSLVIEIEKRRSDAQRLRQEAEIEWDAAKVLFEHKLLGEKV